jgi:hypothetical protein
VLKSPPNTARIKFLLSLFPNARFIFIHRNPYDVYASNKRFWAVVQKQYALKNVRQDDMQSIILYTYSETMKRYLQEKEMVPPNQLVELAYDDFVQRPVESLRTAYNELRLDDFRYCKNKLKAFTGQQRQFVQLTHALPEEERKLVSEKLEPVIRHWTYPLLS